MCQKHDSFLPLYLQRDCPDTAPCSAPALPVISGCWNRTPWSQRVFCARCGYQVVSRWISAVGSAVVVCHCAELCVLRDARSVRVSRSPGVSPPPGRRVLLLGPAGVLPVPARPRGGSLCSSTPTPLLPQQSAAGRPAGLGPVKVK